jgi:formylglycine-generating enzyme
MWRGTSAVGFAAVNVGFLLLSCTEDGGPGGSETAGGSSGRAGNAAAGGDQGRGGGGGSGGSGNAGGSGAGAGGSAGTGSDGGGSAGSASGGVGGSSGSSGTAGQSGADGGVSCPKHDDPQPVRPPSCQGLLETCGPCADESCCTSLLVPGGSFFRSYDGTLYREQTYPASVSDFRLDRFEVTVGRFRPFVAAVVAGWRPVAGSGKHTHLRGGSGIDSKDGWSADWNDWLPKTKATWEDDSHLGCDAQLSAWTPEPGANENRAMNCVSWVEAYAFCIWDQGFLPTEAEWNYAAAGGNEAREYPWGAAPPAPNLAVYYCQSGGTPGCSWNVGSRPAGDGRFGQADLAGSSWEWVLDSFTEHRIDWSGCASNSQLACTDYPIADCADCAYLQTTFANVLRGGSNTDAAKNLRSALRWSFGSYETMNDIGLRCARSP